MTMFAGQTKSLSGFFRGIYTKHGALSPAADAVNATEILVFSWPAVTASTRLEQFYLFQHYPPLLPNGAFLKSPRGIAII